MTKYLRELFVRLQLGLLLNTGEKLHALTGKMKNLVFGPLAGSKFVKDIGIPSKRYAKQTLCAQIAINIFGLDKNEEFSRTRYEDLAPFFEEYADPKGADQIRYQRLSTELQKVLDGLSDIFGAKAGDLKNRSYILSLALYFYQPGIPAADRKKFEEFALALWKRLREEAKLGLDRKNRELYKFQSYLSSAPGEAYQIEGRQTKLEEYFTFYRARNKIKGD